MMNAHRTQARAQPSDITMAAIEILKASKLLPFLTEDLYARYTVHELDDLKDPTALTRVRAIVGGGETRMNGELFDRCPNAKVVSCFGVGYDGVDTAAAVQRGIVVGHTPDVLNDEVADLGLGLMLSVARQIPQADQYVRSGRWAQAPFPLQRKLTGARLGLVGMGRIAKAIAHRAEAFSMSIAYTARSRKAELRYDFVPTVAELAARSDFLLAITPGGDGTKGIINAEVLKALGPRGFFINIARGTVADQPALLDALKNGTIAGAGLDVFYDEPKIDPAFFTLPNVVLTPHMASGTFETRRAMADRLLDNLAAGLQGQRMPSAVPECHSLGL
jgi:lactate dehydrogenase-like 2-hydroxyacid dehydrogenase